VIVDVPTSSVASPSTGDSAEKNKLFLVSARSVRPDRARPARRRNTIHGPTTPWMLAHGPGGAIVKNGGREGSSQDGLCLRPVPRARHRGEVVVKEGTARCSARCAIRGTRRILVGPDFRRRSSTASSHRASPRRPAIRSTRSSRVRVGNRQGRPSLAGMWCSSRNPRARRADGTGHA